MNERTTEAAAQLIGVTRKQIWHWMRMGWVCPAFVSGRSYGFDDANLTTLAKCKRAAELGREANRLRRELLTSSSHPLAQV